MPAEHNRTALLDVRQNQLAFVAGDGVTIDTKALAILATNVALILFAAQANVRIHDWVVYVLLFVPFGISLALDTLAIWPRAYSGASVDLRQHPEYLAMDEDTLVLQLLADTEAAIHKNEQLNKSRWQACVLSISFTAVGTVVLSAILKV